MTKKLLKRGKLDSIDVLGRWKKLIDGIMVQSLSEDARVRSIRISAKWKKLAMLLLKKEEKLD